MEIQDSRLKRFRSEAEFLQVFEEHPGTCTIKMGFIDNNWVFDNKDLLDKIFAAADALEESYGNWRKIEEHRQIVTRRCSSLTYTFNYEENPLNVVRAFYYNEEHRVLIRIARLVGDSRKNDASMRLVAFKVF